MRWLGAGRGPLAVVILGLASAPPLAGLDWVALGRGLPVAGQWRQGFDVADLDGDGHLDIFHGPPRRGDGRPVVFRGDGSGGFSPWAEVRFPDLPFDYGAAIAADFTGDGRLDIALGCHLRGLTVLRAEAPGVFDRWDEGLDLTTSGEAFSSRALAAVDWNRDGRVDLVALGEGPSPGAGADRGSFGLRVLLNGGDGSWSARAAEEPGRIFGYSLGVGAVDEDGRVRVVASSRSQGRPDVLHRPGADGGVEVHPLPGARPRSVLHAVTVHDFDRDGADDVAASFVVRGDAGQWLAGVDLYPLTVGGRREVLLLEEALEISVLAGGDLDADGLPDLVAAGVGGRVWVFRGTRRGRMKRVGSGPIERAARGCKASHARLVDLDGKPGDELVISFSGEPRGEAVCPSAGSIQVWTMR